ncbi:MAG: PQQ-binding-like beta-propeller repeat protein, partial [Bryobacteraceae bacterium]
NTGKTLWQYNLGTIQKASPVLADGKMYVGSENGRFFILKPHNDRAEVLHEVQLGTGNAIEQIIASPAVSNGRVFLVTTEAIYAIGKKSVTPNEAIKVDFKAAPGATPAQVQVVPTDLILKPGQKVQFHARLFVRRAALSETRKPVEPGQLGGQVVDVSTSLASGPAAGKVERPWAD